MGISAYAAAMLSPKFACSIYFRAYPLSYLAQGGRPRAISRPLADRARHGDYFMPPHAFKVDAHIRIYDVRFAFYLRQADAADAQRRALLPPTRRLLYSYHAKMRARPVAGPLKKTLGFFRPTGAAAFFQTCLPLSPKFQLLSRQYAADRLISFMTPCTDDYCSFYHFTIFITIFASCFIAGQYDASLSIRRAFVA